MSTPSGSTPSLTPSRSPSPEPPVQPAFFYNAEGEQPAPSPDATGRLLFTPEDDPLAQRGIPVFKPSMEEFQDFERYMERIECWGNRSGIVKVIPPKDWSDALPSVEPQLANVRIMSPIEQNFLGGTGRFRQQNIEKRRSMSVREWVELCSKDGYHAPSASEVGLHHAPVAGKAKRRVSRRATTETEATDVKEEDEAINVPASPPITDTHAAGSPKEEDEDTKASRPHRRKTHKQVADEKAVKDVAFMAKFKPHQDWLPFGMQPSDYTPEYCKELERHYWRNCGMGKSPWYGADTQGSLFTPDTTAWNVSCLPSYLTRLLPSSSQGLPGVNTPYLYFGMWRATFAWHVEDMDLFSINYIHFGAPKFWYAIPQGRAGAFETTMRNFFPREPTQCSQFLRHKSFLVSPKNLASYSCRPNTLVQHAGEFVITYPRGYHAGFNLGLNCAESVNFALESWVKLGRKARACNCVGDSVRIDVDQLLQDRAAEDAGQAPQDAPNRSSLSTAAKKATQGKKRKAPSPASKDAEMPRAKRIKMRPPHAEAGPSTSGTVVTSGTVATSGTMAIKGHPKSVTLKLGAAPLGEELFPCCLCVGREQEGLLRVQEPPVGVATVALDLSRGWRAHELCARVVPETWVDEVDEGLGFREKVVFGVDAIEKARWQLKCTACVRARAKAHGAPIQCTKGKCSKAFHISCAREGGEAGISFRVLDEVEKQVVLVDAYAAGGGGAMNVDGQGQQGADEGTVIKTIRKTEVEVLCSQHNPTVAASKKAAKQARIRDQLRALPPLSRIKLRVSSGVFEVTLVRVLEEACAVEVIWDRGARREFRWGSVVFGATDMPVEQKPTELVEKEVGREGEPVQVQQAYFGAYGAQHYSGPPYGAQPSAPSPSAQSYVASGSQPYASTSQPYAPSTSQGYGQQPYGAQPYASRPYQAPYHQTYYQAAASQPPYQPYGAQGSQSHCQAAAGQVPYAPATPATAAPAYQGQASAPSYQGQAPAPAYQGQQAPAPAYQGQQAPAPAPPASTAAYQGQATAYQGQATAYQGQATAYQGQASPPPAASGGFSYFGAAPTVQQYAPSTTGTQCAPSTTGTQCAPSTPAPSSTQPSVAAQPQAGPSQSQAGPSQSQAGPSRPPTTQPVPAPSQPASGPSRPPTTQPADPSRPPTTQPQPAHSQPQPHPQATHSQPRFTYQPPPLSYVVSGATYGQPGPGSYAQSAPGGYAGAQPAGGYAQPVPGLYAQPAPGGYAQPAPGGYAGAQPAPYAGAQPAPYSGAQPAPYSGAQPAPYAGALPAPSYPAAKPHYPAPPGGYAPPPGSYAGAAQPPGAYAGAAQPPPYAQQPPPGAYGSTWQHQQQPHYTYTSSSHYRPADRTQLQWQEPYRPERAGLAGEKGGLTSTAQVAPTMAKGAQSAPAASVASASATSTTTAAENGKGEKGIPGQGQTNGAEGAMAEAGSAQKA
ncbi:uncharacterized protein SCHCODRAFT_02629768 [Schizophyllum commune H4-8]|uniref:uncharacterized protein n=1 Tax=Schizophyllum commune (strain H4-8 / FGSC 9210) TaxID=578458 RepID=UPI0021600877|nr:uncharacterized protein SCHCODRAFT_02629768 [Schizophyllum commune H4-8]KAI5891675.1 hypothetical protein SCHCODRAFT_02629768 [Schizophyllum commune H4-8]